MYMNTLYLASAFVHNEPRHCHSSRFVHGSNFRNDTSKCHGSTHGIEVDANNESKKVRE